MTWSDVENECSSHDNEIFIESGNDNGLHIGLLAFIRIVGSIILPLGYGETTTITITTA